MAVTAVVTAVVAGAGPAAAAPGASTVAYRFADPRIDEASGIARGLASPGIDYVQNDSGDTNRFFAVDERTGATAATITVAGARNVDWEDIAVARDPAGVASVWLADVGDNGGSRSEVQVYRVREPRIRPGDRNRTLSVRVDAQWRLHYPTGPVNAESLAVAPGGAAYAVTKSPLGLSTVYRLPTRPDASRVQTLVPVGPVRFLPTGTKNPFGLPGQLAATGAAISPDGSVLAIRTYADAYLWPLRDGDVAAALRTRPVRVPLPDQPQGEGIAVTASSALVDSEGRGSAVYRVPLPALTRPAPTPTTTRPAPATAARSSGGGGGSSWPVPVGIGAGAAVLAGLGLWSRHRRLRRRG